MISNPTPPGDWEMDSATLERLDLLEKEETARSLADALLQNSAAPDQAGPCLISRLGIEAYLS